MKYKLQAKKDITDLTYYYMMNNILQFAYNDKTIGQFSLKQVRLIKHKAKYIQPEYYYSIEI